MPTHRLVRRAAALGVAAVMTLGAAACSRGEDAASSSEASAPASATGTAPADLPDNDGAGIPTSPLSAKQAQTRLLTSAEFPAGAVTSLRAERVGAGTLRPWRELAALDVPEQCKDVLTPLRRSSVQAGSGARVSGKIPAGASVGGDGGNVSITLFTTRRAADLLSPLENVADACVGTVTDPDSITATARGLSGATFVLGSGAQAMTVAGGDWGSNHLLVVMHGADPATAQQIIDAQLAKLSAPAS